MKNQLILLSNDFKYLMDKFRYGPRDNIVDFDYRLSCCHTRLSLMQFIINNDENLDNESFALFIECCSSAINEMNSYFRDPEYDSCYLIESFKKYENQYEQCLNALIDN